MATVMIRRANVLLEIPDDEPTVSKYLADGFDIVNEAGKVIRRSTHGRSEDDLRKELDTVRQQYDRLLAENKDLKAKLEALVAAQEDEPIDEPAKVVPAVEPVEKVEKKAAPVVTKKKRPAKKA